MGLFKCSWLSIGASLTVSCRVRTGELGVSMRFIGPEEGVVVGVSRSPGPGLADIFAAGASLSDAVSPSKGGGKGAEGSSKCGYGGTLGGGVSSGSPANMDFSGFLKLFIHLFMCAYIVWAISTLLPPAPSLCLPPPSLPGRNYSALFFNFVEEKT
jgi:hypothetical protein